MNCIHILHLFIFMLNLFLFNVFSHRPPFLFPSFKVDFSILGQGVLCLEQTDLGNGSVCPSPYMYAHTRIGLLFFVYIMP